MHIALERLLCSLFCLLKLVSLRFLALRRLHMPVFCTSGRSPGSASCPRPWAACKLARPLLSYGKMGSRAGQHRGTKHHSVTAFRLRIQAFGCSGAAGGCRQAFHSLLAEFVASSTQPSSSTPGRPPLRRATCSLAWHCQEWLRCLVGDSHRPRGHVQRVLLGAQRGVARSVGAGEWKGPAPSRAAKEFL